MGTDLAELDGAIGALEMLCIGWGEQLTSLGADVFLFSSGHVSSEVVHGLSSIKYDNPADLNKKLQGTNTDVVVTNNRPLWCVTGKIGRINIFHNYPDAWALPERTSNEEVIDSLRNASNLAVSNSLAEYINKLFPGANTEVLNPFIDEAFIEAGVNARAREFTNRFPIKILFPNRTLDKKGLRWLVDTIDQHLMGKVRLTVVRNISPWKTETAEHRALLALAHSRRYIKVVEKVTDTSELIQLYLAHDVVVTPSIKEEGLGLIPLEAQALGIPVISSDLGGLTESTFWPNRTVPVGSTHKLAQAILRATKTSVTQRSRIKALVAQNFSPANSAKQLKSKINLLFYGDSLR